MSKRLSSKKTDTLILPRTTIGSVNKTQKTTEDKYICWGKSKYEVSNPHRLSLRFVRLCPEAATVTTTEPQGQLQLQ